MIGGLGFQNKPLLCGSSRSNNCYTLVGNVWTLSPSMNTGREFAGFSSYPSQNQSRRLIVTGGYGRSDYAKNAEVLTEKGWEILQEPRNFYGNCHVVLNSTTVMIIGPDITYFLNPERNAWVNGPTTLLPLREFHSCALIKKDSNSQEMNVIIAGGFHWSQNKSNWAWTYSVTAFVEIFNVASNTWRRGPDLPIPLAASQMVEGPDGGVAVIGGTLDDDVKTFSDSLYYLPHAGPGAVWTKMQQKLKIARANHVAFLVPDEYC
jgi:hypothetical protein